MRKYGGLYSQTRLETLDNLDKLPQLVSAEELKNKLLFSVMVVSSHIQLLGLSFSLDLPFSLLSTGFNVSVSRLTFESENSIGKLQDVDSLASHVGDPCS